MIVTTPAESLLIVVLNGGPAMYSSRSSAGANSAAWWNRPPKTARSIVASKRTFPFSLDSVGVQAVKRLEHDRGAFGRRQRGPRRPGRMRGSHRVERVVSRGGGGMPDDRPGVRRVVDGEGRGPMPFLAPDKQ